MKATRRGFLGGVLAGFGVAAVRTESDAQAAEGTPGGDVVNTEVNGTPFEARVGDDESALHFVRERCGLTGAKPGCGHGACGACAVTVDGRPVASCLLPAAHLHGKRVHTVEGFAELHPVQRAFMAEDALQCGYCTPGFVVEAAAFTDAWRAGHGAAEPSREVIAKALSGHLCRCGAYPQIYAAVAAACRGEHDATDPIPPRAEARAKVTGAAKYTVDQHLDGMIVGRILRSPHASAVIQSLDLEPARRVPGVRAVVRLATGIGTVRYVGQELAAVAADDEESLRAGLAAIAIDYDVRAPVMTVEDARAAGAPLVYEKRARKGVPNANESPLFGGGWEGNARTSDASLLAHPRDADRAIEAARAGAGRLIEATYAIGSQVHTPLEPRGCVASWDGARMIVYTSTQSVHLLAADVAELYDLKVAQIEVHAEHVGGAFGSKVGLQMEHRAAVELTLACKLPVKVVLDRTEELTVGGSRPAVTIDLALASDADGAMAAVVGTSTANSGAAVGGGVGWHLRVSYGKASRHLTDVDVATNAAPSKPFRGPGGPAAFFAYESMMDEHAAAAGIDPLALRQRWDENPVRTRLYSKLAEIPLWRDRPAAGADKGRHRRGVGLASAGWMYLVHGVSQVRLDTGGHGLLFSTAAQDMGNGTRSMLAHAAASAMDLAPSDVEVRVGHSTDVPAPYSAGSRTTASLAPSAKVVARQAMDALFEAALRAFGPPCTRVPGGVEVAGEHLPWPVLARRLPAMTFVANRPRDPGGYFFPFAFDGTHIGNGLNGCVAVTEVEVDTRLGRARALRNWTGIGCGELVAPVIARSQVQGAVVQGISHALYEERVLDRATGHVLTHDLEQYHLLGLGDTPEIDVYFDTEPWEGTLGPIGISEVAGIGQPAALANAVFNATGARARTLPLRLDRVLMGVGS